MLGFLFRGLTADPARGAPLFDALTREARRPEWYVEAAVPDAINGRFAVLATVVALTLVRLEQEGESGERMSVALTERFIQVMESEHRELGISDPSLGKTVRKLVAMLARRTELWRSAASARRDWAQTARESLYAEAEPGRENLTAASRLTQDLWAGLEKLGADELEKGGIA